MPFFLPPVFPTPSDISLHDQTILITGGNTGLGYESARQFLVLGASTVILACRNVAKGTAARDALLDDPTIKSLSRAPDIPVKELEMESYQSVTDFADAIKKEYSKLHILLLNAGVALPFYETSPYTGHEKVFQVNFLSSALLALSLLPLLTSTAESQSSPTRLSWVGSRASLTCSLIKPQTLSPDESVFAHLDDKSKRIGYLYYGDTKMLCTMFVQELSKHVPKEKVTVNIMCPGMTKTALGDNLPFYYRWPLYLVQAMRARTLEVGTRVLVHAAAVAGEESHGKYLDDKDVME